MNLLLHNAVVEEAGAFYFDELQKLFVLQVSVVVSVRSFLTTG
jgi:hypothetical protein